MMGEIIKAQHKGVFREMRGVSEEPRATKTYTEETSNMLRAH